MKDYHSQDLDAPSISEFDLTKSITKNYHPMQQSKHTPTNAKWLSNFFSYLTKSFLNLLCQELVPFYNQSSSSRMTTIITTINLCN